MNKNLQRKIKTQEYRKMSRAYVYVLRCQGSPPNWYVGSSRNLEARLCEHFAGQGSAWTVKHPPISVTEVIECPDGDPLPLERGKVVELCFRYSWRQVRGAGFVRVDAGMPGWLDEKGDRRKPKAEKAQETITLDTLLHQDTQDELEKAD